MRAFDLVLFIWILSTCTNLCFAQTPATKTVIVPGDGVFPLWWSSSAYVWGFIKLGYILAGLLALFVYRHWAYDSEPDYANYHHYRSLESGNGPTVGINVDEKIVSFGHKFK